MPMFTLSLKNKVKNLRLAKKTFRFLQLKKALIFPRQLVIEVTSLCNGRCIHCEYSKLDRPHAHMAMDLYKKIIDECHKFKKYCQSLSLYWMGEPLLDPTFFEKVKYATEKNSFAVSINSNGSLLTPENCQKLIDSKLDQIIFGVDGATKESYEAVRVGLSYQNVVEGIKRLAALKRKLNIKHPQIKVRMTLTPFNSHEIDLFQKTWAGIADRVFARDMHAWGGDTIDEKMRQYSYRHVKADRSQSVPCLYLWRTMVVSQDGRVALCCVDARLQQEIGDLHKESIDGVWHGEKLNKIRKMHLAGKMDEIHPCRGCNFRQTKGAPWWWYGK